MLLRFLVCLGMCIFSLFQGLKAASIPVENGRHYFSILYILVVILLCSSLNKRGLVTWPIATLLLLIKGHYIAGWIPLWLVIFNLIGNKIVFNK